MTNQRLVLTAMIFAVAMLFIDQTIVALAIPNLQHDLHLSSTGSQWVLNAYLLSLSALFALGGKIADVDGPRKVVLIGVSSFALFSALSGATPTGSLGESWMILFRVLQGASAALLFPAALAIVVVSYPAKERGKALGPVSTDALNRASRATYGAVTGVTQTVRNFGGSLGLAVLGSILITENVKRVERTLGKVGVPRAKADSIAHAISGASEGSRESLSNGKGRTHSPTHAVQLDFAHSTQTVVYGMAGAMAVAFLVAVRAMPRGRAEEVLEEEGEQATVAPLESPAPGGGMPAY